MLELDQDKMKEQIAKYEEIKKKKKEDELLKRTIKDPNTMPEMGHLKRAWLKIKEIFGGQDSIQALSEAYEKQDQKIKKIKEARGMADEVSDETQAKIEQAVQLGKKLEVDVSQETAKLTSKEAAAKLKLDKELEQLTSQLTREFRPTSPVVEDVKDEEEQKTTGVVHQLTKKKTNSGPEDSSDSEDTQVVRTKILKSEQVPTGTRDGEATIAIDANNRDAITATASTSTEAATEPNTYKTQTEKGKNEKVDAALAKIFDRINKLVQRYKQLTDHQNLSKQTNSILDRLEKNHSIIIYKKDDLKKPKDEGRMLQVISEYETQLNDLEKKIANKEQEESKKTSQIKEILKHTPEPIKKQLPDLKDQRKLAEEAWQLLTKWNEIDSKKAGNTIDHFTDHSQLEQAILQAMTIREQEQNIRQDNEDLLAKLTNEQATTVVTKAREKINSWNEADKDKPGFTDHFANPYQRKEAVRQVLAEMKQTQKTTNDKNYQSTQETNTDDEANSNEANSNDETNTEADEDIVRDEEEEPGETPKKEIKDKIESKKVKAGIEQLYDRLVALDDISTSQDKKTEKQWFEIKNSIRDNLLLQEYEINGIKAKGDEKKLLDVLDRYNKKLDTFKQELAKEEQTVIDLKPAGAEVGERQAKQEKILHTVESDLEIAKLKSTELQIKAKRMGGKIESQADRCMMEIDSLTQSKKILSESTDVKPRVLEDLQREVEKTKIRLLKLELEINIQQVLQQANEIGGEIKQEASTLYNDYLTLEPSLEETKFTHAQRVVGNLSKRANQLKTKIKQKILQINTNAAEDTQPQPMDDITAMKRHKDAVGQEQQTKETHDTQVEVPKELLSHKQLTQKAEQLYQRAAQLEKQMQKIFTKEEKDQIKGLKLSINIQKINLTKPTIQKDKNEMIFIREYLTNYENRLSQLEEKHREVLEKYAGIKTDDEAPKQQEDQKTRHDRRKKDEIRKAKEEARELSEDELKGSYREDTLSHAELLHIAKQAYPQLTGNEKFRMQLQINRLEKIVNKNSDPRDLRAIQQNIIEITGEEIEKRKSAAA